MNGAEQSLSGRECTLWKLLDVRDVRIPLIQRDFVHGRKGKEHLRESVLKSLFSVLSKKEKETVRMDFVYGVEKSLKDQANTRIIYPLDGQQRLTTLWLVHWYVALMAGVLTETGVVARMKRFSYETRASSRDFCRVLVENAQPIRAMVFQGVSVCDAIRRQTAYLRKWAHDPTIASMLRMLEGTLVASTEEEGFGRNWKDGIVKWCEQGWTEKDYKDAWDRLTGADCPITFFYQSLDGFRDADGLYVKMNARGKPLSQFENFKAELSQMATIEKWANNVPGKLDNEWNDIFWIAPSEGEEDGKNPRIHSDDRYLAFVNRLMFNDLAVAPMEDEKKELLTHFYTGRCTFDAFEYYQEVFASENRRNLIFNILDRLFVCKTQGIDLDAIVRDSAPAWFNESQQPWLLRLHIVPSIEMKEDLAWQATDRFFCDEIGQSGRVWFLAVCCFVSRVDEVDLPALKNKESDLRRKLKDWLRVVANVIENARIDTEAAMIGTMKLVHELSPGSLDILRHLKNHGLELKSNASSEQVKEEIEKACRILDEEEGVEGRYKEISEAEGRFFFKGQIRTLYRNGDGEECGGLAWNKFGERLKRMGILFNANGSPKRWTLAKFARYLSLDVASLKEVAFIWSPTEYKQLFRLMHDRGGNSRKQLANFLDRAHVRFDQEVGVGEQKNQKELIRNLVDALVMIEGIPGFRHATRILTNWTATVRGEVEMTYQYVLTDYANRQKEPNNGLFVDLTSERNAIKSEIKRYAIAREWIQINEDNGVVGASRTHYKVLVDGENDPKYNGKTHPHGMNGTLMVRAVLDQIFNKLNLCDKAFFEFLHQKPRRGTHGFQTSYLTIATREEVGEKAGIYYLGTEGKPEMALVYDGVQYFTHSEWGREISGFIKAINEKFGQKIRIETVHEE